MIGTGLCNAAAHASACPERLGILLKLEEMQLNLAATRGQVFRAC